jgi:dTDP-4-dehydrorhamnose reductase
MEGYFYFMGKPCDYLVIGANGLVGSAVAKELDSQFSWVGTAFRRSTGSLRVLDITDKDNVKAVLTAVRPKTVVLAANLAGGAEFAQTHPDLAKKFYFEATKNVGELCRQQNAGLIFISTECVFDGKKEVYREEDDPNPLNLYGQWKTESEMWIKKNLENYLIVRTMSVFGWQPETVTPNAFMKAYFSISKKEKMLVPTFRWGTPTYVHDLAKALVELSSAGARGTYHVVGSSFINRYEWLNQTCAALGWDTSWLCPQNEVPSKATPYPTKVRLDTQKFRLGYKTRLHTLEESIPMLKNDIRQTAVSRPL